MIILEKHQLLSIINCMIYYSNIDVISNLLTKNNNILELVCECIKHKQSIKEITELLVQEEIDLDIIVYILKYKCELEDSYSIKRLTR